MNVKGWSIRIYPSAATAAAVGISLLLTGCSASFNVFSDKPEPLREHVIDGDGSEKVLVISIDGIISDAPGGGLLHSAPSMVESVVAQLRMAEKDDRIKALLLKVDSPGGSTTASDILYQEILNFKQKNNVKIVAVFMDVATSGGYYVALSADRIFAHPTTVTGSVGVLLVRPKIHGLMDKIGVGVDVVKSGLNKDMGSPFRQPSQEEEAMFQKLIDELGTRFVTLAATHRKLDEQAKAEVASARVFLANDALRLGLVDEIGYLADATASAKKLAGLDDDAKVVAYRRKEFPNDTLYNNAAESRQGSFSLVSLGPFESLAQLRPGFYYLWLPGFSQ